MTLQIQSRNNARIVELAKNHDRWLMFEGEKLVRDLVQRKIAIEIMISTQQGLLNDLSPYQARETWLVSAAVFRKISTLQSPAGIMALAAIPRQSLDFAHRGIIFGVDHVQDPGNLGTIFRCAAAFGIRQIALTGETVKVSNAKFLRACQDSIFAVNFQSFPAIGDLLTEADRHGLPVYLTSSQPQKNCVPFGQVLSPGVVILGSEGQGLQAGLHERYPTLTIYQEKVIDSLNVSISACIIMHELRKNNFPS